MLARWIGLVFGMWHADEAFSPDLFDDDADTLSTRPTPF